MTGMHHAVIKAGQRGRLRFASDQPATLPAACDTSGLVPVAWQDESRVMMIFTPSWGVAFPAGGQ